MFRSCLVFFMIAMLASGNVWARRGHTHVFVGAGIPYWGWPSYHYYPHYPPVVIERSPPVIYIEKPVESVPRQSDNAYWYYCAAAKGYYPYVRECPAGWMKVLPQAPTAVSP